MHGRHTWTILSALAIVALAPACSSNSTSSPPTSAVPQAHGAYEQCLADHGVPGPSGPPSPGNAPHGPAPGPPSDGTPRGAPPPPPGVDQTTWNNAISACKSLVPSPPAGNR